MLSIFSIIISGLAFTISGITAWLTFFRKGKLLMTQPTIIFFGPDGSYFDAEHNKIYLRTLLYSTSKRGQLLESLHASVQRNETKQNFNVWVYGENGELKRGSGLFVPQEGIAYNHHFLLPKDGANFHFLSGKYKLTIYAKLVGNKTANVLSVIEINISESQSIQLKEPNSGIYFDWGPDQQNYFSHIDYKKENKDLEEMIGTLLTQKDKNIERPSMAMETLPGTKHNSRSQK